MRKREARVIQVHPADENNQVLTIETKGSGDHLYRRKPCGGCPWVVDNTGSFPPEAFLVSAHTCHDAGFGVPQGFFGCHESGKEKPATCAGFILRADHSMSLRLAYITGKIDPRLVHDDGRELHENYYEMATANGVDPDHPEILKCR